MANASWYCHGSNRYITLDSEFQHLPLQLLYVTDAYKLSLQLNLMLERQKANSFEQVFSVVITIFVNLVIKNKP